MRKNVIPVGLDQSSKGFTLLFSNGTAAESLFPIVDSSSGLISLISEICCQLQIKKINMNALTVMNQRYLYYSKPMVAIEYIATEELLPSDHSLPVHVATAMSAFSGNISY